MGALAGGGTVTATVRLTGAYQTFTFPTTWQNLASLTITASHDTLSSPTLALVYAMDNVTFTIPSCQYQMSINRTPVAGGVVGSLSGAQSFGLDTSAGCPWSVSQSPDWVTFTSPTSGSGGSIITFNFAANTGAGRKGIITIAGVDFVLQQVAATVPSLIGSLPHIAAQDVWTTSLFAVNKTASPLVGRILLTRDGGAGLPLYLAYPQGFPLPLLGAGTEFTLPPNGIGVATSVGPQTPPVEVGAGRVFSDGAMDGFAIFRLLPGSQEAVVPMETRNAESYLLAFDNTGGVVLGVAVQNVAEAAATIPVVIRDDTGTVISPPGATISLPATGHTSFVLSQRYSFTANKRGTIEFQTPTGGRISVLGIRTTPFTNSTGTDTLTLTTVPALAEVDKTGGSIAHIATGNGWQSTFVLVNTGTSAADATLKFFATGTGNPLSIPLSFPQAGGGASATANSVTRTLAAGASLIIQSRAPASDPAPTVGSAQLTTNGNVGGFVIFRYNPNGQEAVVPLESRTAGSFLIAYDNTAGTVTGIALNSVSAQSVSVPVIVRDDDGAQIESNTVTLAPNGQTSFTLGADKFPVTAGKRGTIEFVTPSGGQIGALGIRIPPTFTFTTLPALAK